jgi:hypothetical protein
MTNENVDDSNLDGVVKAAGRNPVGRLRWPAGQS